MIEGPVDGEWLRSRWQRRFATWGRSHVKVGDDLMARYAAPDRVYHDLRHLRCVLEAVDELVTAPGMEALTQHGDRWVMELAAWFHDAVYDVRRADNEIASAALARELLAPHLTPERVAEVARVVLLTEHHDVAAGDRNGAVVCDADLVVLAGTAAAYDDYVRSVRAEYAHVSDEEFRAGRAAVLQSLLDLPALFHTEHGAATWEASARANLRRELTSLR